MLLLPALAASPPGSQPLRGLGVPPEPCIPVSLCSGSLRSLQGSGVLHTCHPWLSECWACLLLTAPIPVPRGDTEPGCEGRVAQVAANSLCHFTHAQWPFLQLPLLHHSGTGVQLGVQHLPGLCRMLRSSPAPKEEGWQTGGRKAGRREEGRREEGMQPESAMLCPLPWPPPAAGPSVVTRGLVTEGQPSQHQLSFPAQHA